MPHNAPDTLYYWGVAESYLGGTITVSDKGPTGATGSTGPAGSAGPTGATGAGSTVAGPIGGIGPAGVAGPTGPTGGSGIAGATGATGSSGIAGPTGATGATGSAGSAGAAGATGSVGSAGAVGATGATGNAGNTGLAGDEPVSANYVVTIASDKYNIGLQGETATANAILNLHKGFTYEFDLSDSSNSGKTFKFSETSDGTHSSGGVEYTTGVKTTGTAGSSGAKVEIKIAHSSKNVLYYYSSELPSASGTGYLEVSVISTGATGATGATGSAGAAGSNGAVGATGSTGATGGTGSAGAAGAVGATGSTGTTGATGAGGVTHTVTVSNASGSNAYLLNGAYKDGIILFRGYTYYFDQSSSTTSGHQIYIATSAGGAGSNNYNYGQSYSGTAGSAGVLTFTVPHDAPSHLHYECSSHSNMGGTITITSQGITGAKGDTGSTGVTGAAGPAGSVGSTGPTGGAGSQGNDGSVGSTGATGPGGSGGTAPVVSTRSLLNYVTGEDRATNIFDTAEYKSAPSLSVADISNASGVVSEPCTFSSFKVYITQNALTDSGSSATVSIYKNGTTTNIETVLNSSSVTNTFISLQNSISGQSSSLDIVTGDRLALVVKMLGTVSTDLILLKLSAVTAVGAGATGPAGAAGGLGNTGPTGASGSVNTGDIKKYSLIFG